MKMRTGILGLIVVSAFGCSSKKESSSSATDTGGTNDGPGHQGQPGEVDGSDPGAVDPGKVAISANDFKETLLDLTPVEPPVVENTAPAIRSGTVAVNTAAFALAGTNCRDTTWQNVNVTGSTTCADLNPGHPDYSKERGELCNLIQEVKCRFFNREGGPDSVFTILQNLDKQISETDNLSAGKYVPCADPENKGFAGDEQEKAFDAYKLVEFTPTYTFTGRKGQEQKVDPKFTYKFSCYSQEQQNTDHWSAFGFEKGSDGLVTKYYGDGTVLDSATIAAVRPGSKIEIWFSIGGAADSYDVINGSTGVGHLKSDPEAKTIEFTQTGVGLGAGCGVHLRGNDKHLFIKANSNQDRTCNAVEQTDDLVNDTNGTMPDYDPAIDGATYCFDVSGEYASPVAMQKCLDDGLDAAKFTMDSLSRSVVEAYHGPKMFSEKPEGVPVLRMITIEPPKAAEP